MIEKRGTRLKNPLSFTLSVWIFILSASPLLRAETPKSLNEVFSAALSHSEVVAIQNELALQTQERYRQARGGILPQLNFNASHYRQEEVPSTLGRNISPSSQSTARFTVTQPLFRGFREFAVLRQTKKLTEAQLQQRAQALLLLYQEIAQNYVTILSLEQDLRNIKSELELYESNIQEIRKRVTIGRSRLNESLTLQAAQSQLQAEQEVLRGQLAAARETLAYLTGLEPTALLKPLDSNLAQKASLESYLASLENRPDIKASSLLSEAAEENIAIQKGAHLPSLDLTGNYYLKRAGVNADSNWDATLGLSIPIFAGGVLQSRVREAASQSKVADLQTAQARRLAEREVRSLYEQLKADQAQLESLSRSQALVEKNYQQTKRDYGLGLTNNLDVLQALQSYRANRRTFDRAGNNVQLDLIQLQIASGQRILQ
jgi:outer membrane protein